MSTFMLNLKSTVFSTASMSDVAVFSKLFYLGLSAPVAS